MILTMAEMGSSGLLEGRKNSWSAAGKNTPLPEAELTQLIHACTLNDRLSQKKIYTSFYGYAKTICDQYSNNYDDSLEILNDGFLKIFKEIHRYKPAYADLTSSFKGWLRKIMIYTAIDYFRKNYKQRLIKDIDSETIRLTETNEDALDKMSYDEIIRSIQQLTPGYRIIFSLYVIEGFTHEEIAEQLGISVGTSKSNLARGRRQLQKILFNQQQIKLNENRNHINSSGIIIPRTY